VFVIAMVITPLATWGGVLVGRSLARWMAATLLPPSMLGALSFLWIVDGREPPRPRRTPPRTAR
jgi:hypothetical protein